MNVEMPDGTIIEGVPDGTTRADIMARWQKRGAATSSPAATDDAPGLGDSLKRAAGLTARYAVEGAASLPGLVLNPLTVAAGRKPWTEALSGVLTSAGLPQPESPGEKISGEISRGIAGGAPVAAGAQWASRAMRSAPSVVRAIAAAPVAEMASQGIGAGASQTVREAGGPEWAALMAGVVSPMAAQQGVAAAKGGARAINEIRRPITQAGRDQIAADTLGRLTQNKGDALRNLDDYAAATRSGKQVGVPGSKPTAGAVAADYGLISGEQAIARGDANPLFSARRAENNAARIADLERLKATTTEIDRLTAKRNTITAPLRDMAFSKDAAPVNYNAVSETVAKLRATPEGGRQETARALDILNKWIADKQSDGRVSARDAYALHQDINDLIRGKVGDDKGAVRLAGGLATQVKGALAAEIEKVAPGFKRYLNTYSRLSKPIDRLEVIRDKLGDADLSRATNALPQLTADGGQYTLSQNKLRNAVEAIKKETRPAAAQSDILSRVLGDLNAETAASRGGKLPGSDTYQNIASANFLNRVLGQTLAESGPGMVARKTLGFAMRPFEPSINDAIVRAYLDPEEMRRLLAMSRTSRASPTLAGYAPSAVGGLLGSFAP